MKRQPEMLLRWNVFEACMIDMLYNNPENYNAPQRLRYIDYLMSATTLRGAKLPDWGKNKIEDEAWDDYEAKAKRMFPNDKRIRNNE